MKFIVTLIALLIERFFDWSHLRHWGWFGQLETKISKQLKGQSPYLVLALSIAPLLLSVLIVEFILDGMLYGLVKLMFELAVLLYCLGPQNLWADAFAAMNALAQGEKSAALEKLKVSFGISASSLTKSLHKQFLHQLFIEANARVFAPVFWFVLLGPCGVVLYRALNVSQAEGREELAQSAANVEAVLNWLPVRLLTLIFALGGQFVQVFACWHKNVLLGLKRNDMMLTECGDAALGIEDEAKIGKDGAAEKSAISLLDRSLIILLVIIAMVTVV